jgi:hypothetical protein
VTRSSPRITHRVVRVHASEQFQGLELHAGEQFLPGRSHRTTRLASPVARVHGSERLLESRVPRTRRLHAVERSLSSRPRVHPRVHASGPRGVSRLQPKHAATVVAIGRLRRGVAHISSTQKPPPPPSSVLEERRLACGLNQRSCSAWTLGPDSPDLGLYSACVVPSLSMAKKVTVYM